MESEVSWKLELRGSRGRAACSTWERLGIVGRGSSLSWDYHVILMDPEEKHRARVWHCGFVSAAPQAPAVLCQGKCTQDPTGNLPGAAASPASLPLELQGWVGLAGPRAARTQRLCPPRAASSSQGKKTGNKLKTKPLWGCICCSPANTSL